MKIRKFVRTLFALDVIVSTVAIVALASPLADAQVETVLPDPLGGHSCWTSGDHPYPTHVVATLVGNDTAGYYGQRVTDAAIRGLFDPGDTLRAEGIKSVTAFCK